MTASRCVATHRNRKIVKMLPARPLNYDGIDKQVYCFIGQFTCERRECGHVAGPRIIIKRRRSCRLLAIGKWSPSNKGDEPMKRPLCVRLNSSRPFWDATPESFEAEMIADLGNCEEQQQRGIHVATAFSAFRLSIRRPRTKFTDSAAHHSRQTDRVAHS